jgi:hypothetical protein
MLTRMSGRSLTLLASIAGVAATTWQVTAQTLPPVENYYRAKASATMRESVSMPFGEDHVRIFLFVGDISTFIKQPPYVVNAIVASTNVQLDLAGKFPLVQAAMYSALPNSAQKDLLSRFQVEREHRIEVRRTDPRDANSRLIEVATEPFAPKAIPGSPSQFCFLATDDVHGGTATKRDWVTFNKPERVYEGVTRCLSSLTGGAVSVVMPLIGAATAGQLSQSQRVCRMRNALVGVLGGVVAFSERDANNPFASRQSSRSSVREIGIVVFSEDMKNLNDQYTAVATTEMPAILRLAGDIAATKGPPTDLQLAQCKE